MTVSISDQVLMVWPTLRPKYSLTSQKPASLTWEKNSEPGADGEDQQRGLAGAQVGWPAARGCRTAVTVATVAEPVARRMSTATSQASSSTDRPLSSTQVGDQLADAGVDQGLLEAAAGADDEQDAGDRRQRLLDRAW